MFSQSLKSNEIKVLKFILCLGKESIIFITFYMSCGWHFRVQNLDTFMCKMIDKIRENPRLLKPKCFISLRLNTLIQQLCDLYMTKLGFCCMQVFNWSATEVYMIFFYIYCLILYRYSWTLCTIWMYNVCL